MNKGEICVIFLLWKVYALGGNREMDIVIRRAESKDAPILTTILSGAEKHKERSKTQKDNRENHMIVTNTYIEKNSVFVAEKEASIVGCCAIHEVKHTIRTKDQLIEPGYWLEQFFVRSSDSMAEEIATQLILNLKRYCKTYQITTLKVLDDLMYHDFYIKMGAVSAGHHLIFQIDEDKTPISLSQKLESLDAEKWEDALYDEEESLYYLEETDDTHFEDSLSNEIDPFLDEIDDTEEIVIHKSELFTPVMHIVVDNSVDKVETPVDKPEEKIKDEKAISRLSYEVCQKSVVPISYTFEKDEKKEVDYEKILETQDQSKVEETVYSYDVAENIKPINPIIKEELAEKKLYQLAYIKIKKWMNEEAIDTMSENKHFDKQRAKILLRDFNHLETDENDKAYAILEKLFGKVGEEIHIEPYFKCSYGYNIEIGDNFYADANCVIDDHALVTIGDDCILSPQVGIYTLAYPLNHKKRKEGYEYARSVHIGNNVWIGGGATIYPGVTIGHNVVISPGAVVINDIPDNVLVAGNPAQVID